MPIFEYTCAHCGKDFEKLVFNRTESINCPLCQGDDVKKKFSVFGMKSGAKFVPSTGSSCGSCASHNCGSCHH